MYPAVEINLHRRPRLPSSGIESRRAWVRVSHRGRGTNLLPSANLERRVALGLPARRALVLVDRDGKDPGASSTVATVVGNPEPSPNRQRSAGSLVHGRIMPFGRNGQVSYRDRDDTISTLTRGSCPYPCRRVTR
jgi:hypothetical protein